MQCSDTRRGGASARGGWLLLLIFFLAAGTTVAAAGNVVDGFDYGELGVDPTLDPELVGAAAAAAAVPAVLPFGLSLCSARAGGGWGGGVGRWLHHHHIQHASPAVQLCASPHTHRQALALRVSMEEERARQQQQAAAAGQAGGEGAEGGAAAAPGERACTPCVSAMSCRLVPLRCHPNLTEPLLDCCHRLCPCPVLLQL